MNRLQFIAGLDEAPISAGPNKQWLLLRLRPETPAPGWVVGYRQWDARLKRFCWWDQDNACVDLDGEVVTGWLLLRKEHPSAYTACVCRVLGGKILCHSDAEHGSLTEARIEGLMMAEKLCKAQAFTLANLTVEVWGPTATYSVRADQIQRDGAVL